MDSVKVTAHARHYARLCVHGGRIPVTVLKLVDEKPVLERTAIIQKPMFERCGLSSLVEPNVQETIENHIFEEMRKMFGIFTEEFLNQNQLTNEL